MYSGIRGRETLGAGAPAEQLGRSSPGRPIRAIKTVRSDPSFVLLAVGLAPSHSPAKKIAAPPSAANALHPPRPHHHRDVLVAGRRSAPLPSVLITSRRPRPWLHSCNRCALCSMQLRVVMDVAWWRCSTAHAVDRHAGLRLSFPWPLKLFPRLKLFTDRLKLFQQKSDYGSSKIRLWFQQKKCVFPAKIEIVSAKH